jgi:mono/diheme cytochrome c family protein
MRDLLRKPRNAGVSLRAISGGLVISLLGAVVAAQSVKTGRTVWDGVFTETQASRATSVFSQSCASCHTLAAAGSNSLVGDPFWKGYTQKTVGDLLTYISANMPNGNGGSLSAASYNDLVALILKSNGFPAGTAEIEPETSATIAIIPKGGSTELPADTLVRVVGCLAKSGDNWVLRNATIPERVERTGTGPQDASRPLGDRTLALKFVLTKLDAYAGQRMSVTGILLGTGGADGINVTTVNRVAEVCP